MSSVFAAAMPPSPDARHRSPAPSLPDRPPHSQGRHHHRRRASERDTAASRTASSDDILPLFMWALVLAGGQAAGAGAGQGGSGSGSGSGGAVTVAGGDAPNGESVACAACGCKGEARALAQHTSAARRVRTLVFRWQRLSDAHRSHAQSCLAWQDGAVSSRRRRMQRVDNVALRRRWMADGRGVAAPWSSALIYSRVKVTALLRALPVASGVLSPSCGVAPIGALFAANREPEWAPRARSVQHGHRQEQPLRRVGC